MDKSDDKYEHLIEDEIIQYTTLNRKDQLDSNNNKNINYSVSVGSASVESDDRQRNQYINHNQSEQNDLKETNAEIIEHEENKRFTSFNVDEEMTWQNGPKKVLDLILFSMQNIIYNSSLFIIYITNMYFVRLEDSSDLIAGFGLASTFIAAFAFASIYAMNYGMQTLGSQAYGAAKYELVSIIFQRGLYVNIVYLLIVSPLFFFLKDVLGFIGIQTIEETQIYSRWSLIFIFLICVERSFRTYLNCQREYFIPTYCAVFAYILHPLWLYLLCTRGKQGIVGVAWAMSITEAITLLLSWSICTWKKKYEKTWFGFKRIALSGWWDYLKVSIQVGASSYIEWFSFEFQTIIVGFLNDEDQMASHSSQVALLLFYFMIPLALNQTIGTYLGNAVGAGQVRLSKNIIKLTLVSIVILSLIMIGVGAAVQPWFIDLYCTNDEMRYYFKKINSIYIYFFMFGDNLQGVFQGILRTIGLEKWANIIFLVCFFVTGTGLSAILVHVAHLGSPGAWWAYASCAYLAVICLTILLKRANIQKCIEQITENVKLQEQEDAKLLVKNEIEYSENEDQNTQNEDDISSS